MWAGLSDTFVPFVLARLSDSAVQATEHAFGPDGQDSSKVLSCALGSQADVPDGMLARDV